MAPTMLSPVFPRNSDKKTASTPSDKKQRHVWGADDDGADDVFDLQFQEQDIYDNVKTAVVQHRRFLRMGQVSFEEVLATLDNYRSKGYRPAPGTVVEGLNHKLEWKCCVVSHTYFDGGREDKDVMTAYIKQDANLKGELDQGNDPDQVRPVRSAVRAVFGDTPMFWMQRTVRPAFLGFRCCCFFSFWVPMGSRVCVGLAAGFADLGRSTNPRPIQAYQGS